MSITSVDDIVDFALDYARRGWPVFPCNPVNKTPLIGSGHNGASRDTKQISTWWRRYPNAMIGVPTGKASGVVAIDPDPPKKEGDPDGRRSWALLLAQHGALYTHTELTPRGGRHVLFRYDPERPLTNSVGGLAGRGIDIRGDGGYIVVAPSKRADGKAYEVEDPLDFFNFAPMPEWLHELIESEPKKSTSERATEQMHARRTVNGSGGYTESFFTRTNTEALRNLTAWVPSVFPRAEYKQVSGMWVYRVTSADLGRDLEEDLSISPKGIKDWGVHDLGDSNGGRRTPINLLIEAGHSRRPDDAALWLCGKIGIGPESLGWNAPPKEKPLAEETPSSDPEVQPIDLWAELSTPSLPDGALPEVIQNLARHQGELMGVDPGGMAMAALTVCAAAIPDSIQVQVKEHDPNWLESARLWTGLVGLPSTKKTPSTSVAVAPLARIDAELYQKYAELLDKYLSLTPKERKGVQRPQQKRAMLQDVTVEHVQEVTRDSPDGILVFHDELAGWFGGMDRYNASAGASANRAFWLQAFNGKPYTWGRIVRGSGYISNLSVCVLGGIQPSVVQRVVEEGVDDGLIQRLCPIVLRPGDLGTDAPPHSSLGAYSALVPSLHNLMPPMGLSGLQVVPLRFSDDAQDLRRELERKHMDLLQLEYISPMLASHIGKYDGIYARLCVLFHCIERASSGQDLGHFIQFDTAERAAKLLHEYLLKHAVSFYCGILGLSDHHSRIVAVAGYILSHRLERVTNRDIQRSVSTMRGLTDRETRGVFEHLEAFGWVTRVAAPRPADPPHWVVSPQVHALFSDRADKERQRRTETRETLAAIWEERRRK